MDPLLKELGEKKQLFQRSVLSLTADLKDARTQMAQWEESFARETKIRQVRREYFGCIFLKFNHVRKVFFLKKLLRF